MGVSELESYRLQFEAITKEAKALTARLTEAQFNWRPAAGHWSIEECLAHLTAAGAWVLAAIDRAIVDGRRRGLTGVGPFDYGSIDRFIVDMTEPPVRDKMPAPKRFVPLHGQPLTAILPTFFHVQSQFLLQLQNAEGLDLSRVRVASPIAPFLKMSLGMTFAQAAAHERRHLIQARRVWEGLPALPDAQVSQSSARIR